MHLRKMLLQIKKFPQIKMFPQIKIHSCSHIPKRKAKKRYTKKCRKQSIMRYAKSSGFRSIPMQIEETFSNRNNIILPSDTLRGLFSYVCYFFRTGYHSLRKQRISLIESRKERASRILLPCCSLFCFFRFRIC